MSELIFIIFILFICGAFSSLICHFIFIYFEDRKKFNKVKSLLDKGGPFYNSDQLSYYLRSLSIDDLKLICDYYGLDINDFIIKH